MTEKPKEIRKVAIIARKGGVGKTSICKGLADSLRRREMKSLLIDWDIERNLTKTIGGTEKATQTITDFLSTGNIDAHTVNEYIDLIPGSPLVNERIFEDMQEDKMSLLLEDLNDRHVIVDLNHNSVYSVKQTKVLCDTFIIVFTGSISAVQGAMIVAHDILERNKLYKKNPSRQIRFCFVHNMYIERPTSRIIDKEIVDRHPTIPLFHVNHRRIVLDLENEKRFLSDSKKDLDSRNLLLGEYDVILDWILKG